MSPADVSGQKRVIKILARRIPSTAIVDWPWALPQIACGRRDALLFDFTSKGFSPFSADLAIASATEANDDTAAGSGEVGRYDAAGLSVSLASCVFRSWTSLLSFSDWPTFNLAFYFIGPIGA